MIILAAVLSITVALCVALAASLIVTVEQRDQARLEVCEVRARLHETLASHGWQHDTIQELERRLANVRKAANGEDRE